MKYCTFRQAKPFFKFLVIGLFNVLVLGNITLSFAPKQSFKNSQNNNESLSSAIFNSLLTGRRRRVKFKLGLPYLLTGDGATRFCLT